MVRDMDAGLQAGEASRMADITFEAQHLAARKRLELQIGGP